MHITPPRSLITKLAATALLLAAAATAHAQPIARQRAKAVVSLMFGYAARADTSVHPPAESHAYMKYRLRTNRRNAILLTVPTMFAIANGGKREYVGETYDRITTGSGGELHATRLLERTTVPHGSKAMPTLLKYLTPRIYGELLVDRHILSPFNRRNRRFYRYRVTLHSLSTATVKFVPKLKSTQLVRGWARVDIITGRVVETAFDGEYDMVRFHTELRMGESGRESLLPKECSLNARFLFLGNDITAEYVSVFGLPAPATPAHTERADTAALAAVRPMPLTSHEQLLFAQQETPPDSTAADAARTKGVRRTLAERMWDNVGKKLLDRIRTDLGPRNQGYFRIDPILNPLYLSYSSRRGITYKIGMRGDYHLSDNSLIEWRFRGGYSFKQRQFYFTIPVTWHFDHRHEGYLRAEWGNGNRITNSTVADAIKHERADSIDWDAMNLNYFRNHSLKLAAHYNITPRLGIEAGLQMHRRTAIDKTGFRAAGKPTAYISSAPTLGIEWRPWGRRGAVFAVDYERSIRGLMRANIEYERCEIDGQYTHWLSGMSALQMRLGTGFYTHKNDNWIFLDYTNFHERNIPGGWNDEWACDFELLGSNWYNASEYYVRANFTYETPLLALSWLPVAGRLIEKERVYINILSVRRLHPYVEYGYGFTTRLFSVAAFLAQKNGRFDGFTCRFGIELFRKW